jgi:hypothetical protein
MDICLCESRRTRVPARNAIDGFRRGGYAARREDAERPKMKSILGALAAFAALAGYAAAYAYALRPGATWLDGQWLFLAALPYNWTLWRLVGDSNFSPDSLLSLVSALAFDLALAYLAGAVIEALARALWRFTRARSRA